MPEVSLERIGEVGVLVRVRGADAETEAAHCQVIADAALDSRVFSDALPAFDSVYLEFDPTSVTADHAWSTASRIGALGSLTSDAAEPRIYRIPIVLGGDYGPDLDDVAREQGLTSDALKRLLCGMPWRVAFKGAPLGAPMLTGRRLVSPVPRMREPRMHIPGGSLALAEHFGIIYPVDTPGGWRLVGRTPMQLLDFDADPPAWYRPGDVFQFVEIPSQHWTHHVSPHA